MGTPKVGASILLLLAVGPLLLLAPWWPLPPLVVAPLIALGAVYLVFIVALSCTWRVKRQREPTEPASSSESSARWQAGRWDIDPHHAYLANVGDAAAYDVTVAVSGTVACTAECVPPFDAQRLSSTSGLPCYVNLSVRQPLAAQPVMSTRRRESAHAVAETTALDVHVRWRTASGNWHVQSATID